MGSHEKQGAIPAGWYPDPTEPETQRYWDGEQWSPQPDATAPQALQPSPAPPQNIASPNPLKTAATIAPLHWRLGARMIDFAILLILNASVNGWFIYQYLSEILPVVAEASRDYSAGEAIGNVAISDRAQRLSLLITIIALLLWLAYELPALLNNGQTVGKKVLGISVVDIASGEKPRGAQAFRRWLLFAFPLIFGPACAAPLMAITAAWCLWDRPARQALYDKFARTIVVVTDSIAKQTPVKTDSTQGS